MTSLKSMHVMPGLLAVFMVAAGSHDGPKLDVSYPDVVTLISPNEQARGFFGYSVAGAGDVNDDGFADVIVGAAFEGPIAAGRAYVFSGPNEGLHFELVSPNEEAAGGFGYSVAGAGDLNQDGFADVIVGAPYEDPDPGSDGSGSAYVFSGQNGTLLYELASPTEREDKTGFGWSVAGAGDVDQDGFGDVIVGAPYEGFRDAGRAYVFSGQNGSVLLELVSPNEYVQGYFGWSVAGAGDVNQDGVADVIVGAQQEANPYNGAGRAYVFSGKDESLLLEFVSPNAQEYGWFGDSVAGAGDVNRDGFSDVVVGAWREDPAGHAYVFSGQNGSLLFEPMSPRKKPCRAGIV
jgi:hypothetical protein